MIDQKRIFFTKIDFLSTSLEVLLEEYLIKDSTRELIYIRNTLRNYSNESKYNIIIIVKYVSYLQKVINKYFLSDIAAKMLKSYNKNEKCDLINRYRDKFCHIYMKREKYYEIQKLSFIINDNKTSIINLYILSKLRSKQGKFLLIKYLYQ